MNPPLHEYRSFASLGLSNAAGSRYLPLPLKVTVCEPLAVLSDSVSVALRVPLAPGVNFSVIEQALFAPSVFPTGHVLVWVKSLALVPLMVMLVTLSV